MNWLKENWFKKLTISLLSLMLLGYLILGPINQSYIKWNFNKPFTYRTTGDCAAFEHYISTDQNDWRDRCEKEKAREGSPIRDFKILRVSNKLGSNKAFIQAELARDIPAEKDDHPYPVTYELRLIGLKWKIDQEMK